MKKLFLLAAAVGVFGFGFYLIKVRPNQALPQPNAVDLVANFSKKLVAEDQVDFFSGSTFQVDALAEPVLFVHFWATWCGPCLSEFPDLMKLSRKFKGKIKIIAITNETDKTEVERFLKVFPEYKESQITIVSDDKQNWVKAFSVDKLPETYIYVRGKFLRRLSGAVNWQAPDLVQYFEDLK